MKTFLKISMITLLFSFSGCNDLYNNALKTSKLLYVEYLAGFISQTQPVIQVPQNPAIKILNGTTEIANGGGYDFGGSIVNTGKPAQFSVVNNGTATLDLTGTPSVIITGNDPGDYSVSNYPQSPIQPDGVPVNFTITFNPASEGTKYAVVTIPNNTGDAPAYSFTIVGNGTVFPVPQMQVAQGANQIASGTGQYDLGNIGLCSSSQSIEFTIQNNGTSDLQLTGNPPVTITGADSTHFSIFAQPSSSIVPAGNSTTFKIIFTPLSRGSKRVTISIPINDPRNSNYTFDLAGTGQAPSNVIVYSSKVTGAYELWRMNPDGTHKQRITQLNDINVTFEYPKISPDRSKIALRYGSSGSSFIYTVGIDNENPSLTKVTRSDFTVCIASSWFQDSQYLAYGGRINLSSNGSAWKVKFDGTEHALLFDHTLLTPLNSGIQIVYPYVDTVNSRYAVVALDTGGSFSEVYTVDFSLSTKSKILNSYRNVNIWSSDGGKLQFSVLSGSWYSNYYCNGDGSGQASVPNIGSNAFLFCWSPDMKYILYGIGTSMYRADFPAGTNSNLYDSSVYGGADWK